MEGLRRSSSTDARGSPSSRRAPTPLVAHAATRSAHMQIDRRPRENSDGSADIYRCGRSRRLATFWASLDRSQRRTLLMMVAVVVGLHVAGFLMLIALVAPHHYRLGSAGAFTRRDRRDRLHARDAPRVRRRSHRGDRQHDAQADGRGQAAAERRLLVLARAFDDRVRARVAALDRDQGARRAGQERRLEPAPGRRAGSARSSRAASST